MTVMGSSLGDREEMSEKKKKVEECGKGVAKWHGVVELQRTHLVREDDN